MKKFLGMMMMVVMMMTVTANVCAQTPNQKQRLSREQLAEVQAKHIAHDLGLDDKTSSKFIDTYTQCQKEVWALGPRPRHKKGDVVSDAQTEQMIKQRFEMSEKILDIRQKYYKKYSQFLTQLQIQRVYEIERQMMKRFAQRGSRKGGNHAGKPRPGRFQGQPVQNK
nr:hypothetical protein [uncultured Prevotella sp.]